MNVKVSENFKNKTQKAVIAIVIFILTYLFLISFAIIFTIFCVVGGFALIAAKPMIITIGLGLGLASVGFFILFFLFKFIFKKHKIDISNLIEITENEEPQLFNLINEIVEEVGTNFPKKVYLSNDVNASVFYNSTFWSMFLPIPKNLQIGLGLVNSVSHQELKAILAHEFGHFSQRTMKVGSYVYNVNQVIHNMLFDNESFDKTLNGWSQISGYFTFFANVSLKIIEGIQWVLNKIYEYVNISYMALSREMEFHADEIAANVAGSDHLSESLLRLDLANHSYNIVLGFYDSKIIENLKSKNVYVEQKFVMNFLAKENEIDFKNNLPLLSEYDFNKYNKSKLNITDQWASHPSVEERVKALKILNIEKENNTESAFTLFSNPHEIQEKFTDDLFSKIEYDSEKSSKIEFMKFKNEYLESFNKNSFPKIYNGYYDYKNILQIDLEVNNFDKNDLGINELYSDEKIDIVYELIALENDKNILNQIANKTFKIKTFDYDGQKYHSKDANDLENKFVENIKLLKNEILENDKAIYKYFHFQALKKDKHIELKKLYENFQDTDKEYDLKMEQYNNYLEMTSFLNETTPYETISANFKDIYKLEISLKKDIEGILKNEILGDEINTSNKDNFTKYLKKDLVYFENETYNNENLEILFNAIGDYYNLLSRKYFLTKKNLLNFQNDLLT